MTACSLTRRAAIAALALTPMMLAAGTGSASAEEKTIRLLRAPVGP